MNPEEDIFEAAAALPAAERPAYLDAVCAGQTEMRKRLGALLRSHDASGFMVDRTAISPGPAADSSCASLEQAGQMIGRYKLMEQIGEGGFGVVWVAEQLEPVRRRVAVKVIKPGMDSREVIARFEQERQALAMMDHPNIAKVFDAGATESGRPYFVMELVRGVRITDYCDQANLPTAERLKLFIAVCQAVQHAHQKGIIHRDLKPSNILVAPGDDGRAEPKVIDFGVAKAIEPSLSDRTVYTQFEQTIGTPAYMSPEQAGLGPMDIDTRSDIYSLGVLLYELLAGRPPFISSELLGAGLDEMRRIIREVDPPRPSTRVSTMEKLRLFTLARSHATAAPKLVSALRGDLDWIVMKALEKDRSRRYETANGLSLDIQRFIANEAVVATPPSISYLFAKLIRRHRLTFAAGAAITSALFLGIVGTTWGLMKAKASARDAKVSEDAERQAKETAQTEALISKTVNDFINTDLFGAASPDQEPDRDLKVRTVLDRAATRLGNRFRDQPIVESAILMTLAQTYGALGENKKALECGIKSVELKSEAFGPEHPHTLLAKHDLAIFYQAAGEPKMAIQLREDGLTLSRKVNGHKHPDTLSAMDGLATSYFGAGRRDEALNLQEDAVQLCREQLGPTNPQTTHAMHNLALIYGELDRPAEALKLLEEVLPLDRESGPAKPVTLRTMHNIAAIYHDLGRSDEALKLNEEVLELRKKFLTPDHPDTINEMNSLGISYINAGRLDEAITILEEAFSLGRKALRMEDAYTLDSMSFLAHAYHRAGKLQDSIELQEEVLPLRRKILSNEHPDTLRQIDELAECYAEIKRMEESLKLREELVELSREMKGRDIRIKLAAMENLANSYAEIGRIDEAIDLGEESLRLNRIENGSDSADTLISMHNLAHTYRAKGRLEDAIRLQEEVLPKLRTLKHPETLNAIHSLAFSYAKSGRISEAIPLQDEVLSTLLSALPSGDPSLAGAMQFMAELYEKDDQKPKADSLVKKVAELQRGTPETEGLPSDGSQPVDEGRQSGPANNVGPVSPDALTLPPGANASSPNAEPETSPEHIVIEPHSRWKWLHPTDGKDPEEATPGFHTAFFLPDFDDSAWQVGRDSDDPNGGFGYGRDFNGVDIGTPEDTAHRRTAYFRHTFETTEAHANLELRCRLDDGIIVYLDGKEVLRDNMEAGPDAYLLVANIPVGPGEERVLRRFPIPGPLAPGHHTLAISAHNLEQPSSDIRLGGVSLVDVTPPATAK